MINLTVTSNTKRTSILVSGSTTIREAFSRAGIDCSKGLVSLDGQPIRDIDATLDQCGAGSNATLMSIIKNDNAR